MTSLNKLLAVLLFAVVACTGSKKKPEEAVQAEGKKEKDAPKADLVTSDESTEVTTEAATPDAASEGDSYFDASLAANGDQMDPVNGTAEQLDDEPLQNDQAQANDLSSLNTSAPEAEPAPAPAAKSAKTSKSPKPLKTVSVKAGKGHFLWAWADDVNVRAAPSKSAAKVGKLNYGDQVSVYGQANGFVKIGDSQFVARRYLTDRKSRWNARGEKPAPKAPTQDEIQAQKEAAPGTSNFIVDASTLNVRKSPATGGAIVGKLKRGTQVSGTLTSTGWLEIEPGQYVYRDYLRPASTLAH